MKKIIIILTLLSLNLNAETIMKIPSNQYKNSIKIINSQDSLPPIENINNAQCGTDYLTCIKGNLINSSNIKENPISWSCELESDIKQCSKEISMGEIGVCGTSTGQTLLSKPTQNLCETSFGETVVSYSSGYFNWSCKGENVDFKTVGQDVNCQAIANTNQKSCLDILNNGLSTGSGTYNLFIGGQSISAYCDMTSNGGGWTLISKFQAGNLSCDFRSGNACNSNLLSTPTVNGSALMNVVLIRELNEGSPYRELRAVSSLHDVVLRRADLVFPVDQGIVNGRTLQCRNINAINWFTYSIGSSATVDHTKTRGLTTWVLDTNYIGHTANQGVCGNGISFSGGADHQKNYQAINSGYTAAPATSGVFYIR